MAPQATEPPYYLVPNLRATDPAAREIDLNAHSWIQATVIEDEDLMFGGKALSAWYEEERRRLSGSSDEEERRGRQRVSCTQPLIQSTTLPARCTLHAEHSLRRMLACDTDGFG
jgi:GAF domain-containing protein